MKKCPKITAKDLFPEIFKRVFRVLSEHPNSCGSLLLSKKASVRREVKKILEIRADKMTFEIMSVYEIKNDRLFVAVCFGSKDKDAITIDAGRIDKCINSYFEKIKKKSARST